MQPPDTPDRFALSDKLALVTGSTRGIGAAALGPTSSLANAMSSPLFNRLAGRAST